MLWLFLLLVDKGQRFQIVIEDLAFFVRQLQECVVQMIQVVIALLVAHLFHPVFHAARPEREVRFSCTGSGR
ncbi:hypothetical protein BANRA_05305 [Klebsiella pneumoniae]|nr:hypothetical protein BANRA_05305 [Klebsiella pneumoniae]